MPAENRRPLTEPQRRLVAENLGLAHAEARRWRGDPQEVLDAATEGLIRAARGWDPALGYRFSTYATASIRSTIHRAYKASRRLKRTPAGRMLSLGHDGAGVIEPAAPEVADPYAGDDFETLTRPLRARDRDVLRMRFVDGLVLAEVGERLGLTRERVRQIESRALARLRQLRTA